MASTHTRVTSRYDSAPIAAYLKSYGGRLAIWTARDIRSRARRSITRVEKGKTKGRKKDRERFERGLHSPPGHAPYSKSGNIARIEYAVHGDEVYVGPRQFDGGHGFTWSLFEKGGRTAATVERQKPPFSKRKFVRRGDIAPRPPARKKQNNPRPRRDPRVHETIPGARPDGYRYFTGHAEWFIARNSERFTWWSKRTRVMEKLNIDIGPRPFMIPAMDYEVSPARMKQRMRRAMEAAQKVS